MYSFEKLPNEIVYRIFDNLDVNSIISLTCTCQRFVKCRNLYQNYKINFQSISKNEFDCVCNRINPENIIELTLSDDEQTPGQIKYLIDNYPLNQLNRLIQLKLIQINENDLEKILKYFV